MASWDPIRIAMGEKLELGLETNTGDGMLFLLKLGIKSG